MSTLCTTYSNMSLHKPTPFNWKEQRQHDIKCTSQSHPFTWLKKFAKIVQFVWAKSSDPDPVQNCSGFRSELAKKFRIRPNPDPQHWIKEQ